MSKETIQWLNENTMIGHVSNKEKWASNGWMMETDGVFKAWWQQPNYRFAYPGAIPVEDVVEYLFNWEPVEAAIHLRKPCNEADADGNMVETGTVTLGVHTSVAQLKAIKALGEALERIEQLEARLAAANIQ